MPKNYIELSLASRIPIEMQPGDKSPRDAAWRRWDSLSPEEKAKENEELLQLVKELERVFGSGGP